MTSSELKNSDSTFANRRWLVIGCAVACLSVAFGAFGAHGLESQIDGWYPDSKPNLDRLENWKTAAQYQMYAALGLIALGLYSQSRQSWQTELTGWLLFAGMLIFSGCLYLLVLTDVRILGAIVAIGGTLQLAGWALFAIAVARRAKR